MTQVTFRAGNKTKSVNARSSHFLLRNDEYTLSLGAPNGSNYNGLYWANYKVLHNLWGVGDLQSLTVKPRTVARVFSKGSQQFFLTKEGLVVNISGENVLILDCKERFNESEEGREYAVQKTEKSILVTYRKDLQIAIESTVPFTLHNEWEQTSYAYDARRGTYSTPWTYKLATFSGDGKITMSIAKNAHTAKRKAKALLLWRQEKEEYTEGLNKEFLKSALGTLTTETGIFAGLPWFFQEWSRDELISAGGLLCTRQYDHVITILDKWHALAGKGVLPAIYPATGLESTDAPGWLGRRTADLLTCLVKEGKTLPKNISQWRIAEEQLLLTMRQRLKGGLVYTGYNTTWMDTAKDDDGRAGMRIEIQALALALYDSYAKLCALTKHDVHARLRNFSRDIVTAVHERLIVDGKLLDGLNSDGTPDTTARPNIFLAHYAAPRMFTKKQWKNFFAHALRELELSWGGLSTIAQSSPNYHPRYTGEDSASYHRGDSWYFVNNMAALALHTVDKEGFRNTIENILAASLRDCFTQGFLGHCSEVSSAEEQEACGCWAQAWSTSTLLELVYVLNR